MWFTGVEVEQEKSAPPPKKSRRSAPGIHIFLSSNCFELRVTLAKFTDKYIYLINNLSFNTIQEDRREMDVVRNIYKSENVHH